MAVVVAAALSAVSGILIPLVIALVLGVLLEPVVEALRRRRVPATLAAALTLLGCIAVLAGTVAVVVRGLVVQLPEIHGQLVNSWDALMAWIELHDVDSRWLDHARSLLDGHSSQLGQGILGAVTHTFYGAVALVMGTFFSMFFLFFSLRDSRMMQDRLTRLTPIRAGEITEIMSVTRQSVRGYFKGTAITALLTAPIFMVPLLLLGIPLVAPIFVLYFFLSFVPFIGAWLTGAFVVLIAFGTGGPTAALIMAITFIVSNGTIQSAVNSWALGSSLQLHPAVVLLVTMIGGVVAGVLGMVLGAPLLASVVKSVAILRDARAG